MKVFLMIIGCLIGIASSAQIKLERQVIGSAGQSVQLSNNKELSMTVGEAVIMTVSGDSTTLTQGFHQPHFLGNLSFKLEISNASCPYATDGSVRLIELAGCRGPYTIAWSNGARGEMADDLGPGLFSVTVTTPDCALSESFEINSGSELQCDIRFFNAFSPNSDGTNDVWEIENIEIDAFSDNEVEIFNRWGQTIYSARNYNNESVAWKGLTSNGNQISDGTYFYVVRVNEDIYKGYIELTR